ncbi:serine hydrolase [Halobacillus yeomjeoni]|uniref:serine-type D-Ala-D-Ala carboxypeptidase n=1 Tax=Halobacillus yeomjeoni TaxID=311194 RepID=A0A931MUQ4_9BACI|nr:serine hydrolase [Halobacillus yeomjeoni]MBH0230233.1 D-alanyl-D-alanine carboxypeptidase [Halobacillus yeomjeoni]
MIQRFKASLAITLAIILSFTAVFAGPKDTYASTVAVEAKSAILVDAETGKVLFEKEADLTLPPASMTKMMTEYLVLEAIDEGKISWDTTTQISQYAFDISANPEYSGVGLKLNKDYTVRELYEAMAVNSDNATTIALAELLAGTEGEFVKMMNEKAKEMGLPDYEFVNSSGLNNSHLDGNHPEGTEPDATNLLSARSAALLAYHLINDYPESLEFSGQTTAEIDGQKVTNWNWMIPNMPGSLSQFGYEGVDGLKTGYTDLAGNCFTGTAERSGQRFIAVVMKADSRPSRFRQTAKLFDYGFQQFQRKELFEEGYQIDGESELPVTKGKEDVVELETNDSLSTLVKKGDEENYTIKYNISKDKLDANGKLVAPVEKGQKVGTAELVYSGEDQYDNILSKKTNTVDLVTTSSVEKANWFMLMIGGIGEFFSDIFSGAVDMVKSWF